MALVISYTNQVFLTILAASALTGPSIIGDAAIMAASTHPGDYGRVRTWANVAWVVCAPIAGWVNDTYGNRAGIAVYVAGSLPAVPPGFFLPLHYLAEEDHYQTGIQEEEEKEEKPSYPRVVAIAAEPPPPPPSPPPQQQQQQEEEIQVYEREEQEQEEQDQHHSEMLQKALAIVQYIEAVTEVGVQPPLGGLYGFAEVSIPYASSHIPVQSLTRTTNSRHTKYDEGGGGGDSTPDDVVVVVDEETTPQKSITTIKVKEEDERTVHPSISPSSPSSVAPPPQQPNFYPLPPGLLENQLTHAASASDLLRSVREIIPSPSPLPPSPPSTSFRRGGGGRGTQDVDLWSIPGSKPSPYSPPSSSQSSHTSELFVAELDEEEEVAQDNIEEKQKGEDEEQQQRHSAFSRLIQLFTSHRADRESNSKMKSIVADEEDDEVEDEEQYSTSSSSPSSSLLPPIPTSAPPYLPPPPGFTPVSNNLTSRRNRLHHNAVDQNRRRRRGVLVSEPSLTIPLLGDYEESNDEKDGHRVRQHRRAEAREANEALFPPLSFLREALDVEASNAHTMADPTGSYVVRMLTKKLERMVAAERQRQEGLQQQRRGGNRRRKYITTKTREVDAAHVPDHEELPHPPIGVTDMVQTGDGSANVIVRIKQRKQPATTTTFTARIKSFVSNSSLSQITPFFALASLLGFGHGVIGTYLFLFLHSTQGAKESFMGWVLLANALPEMPVFWFFGSIVRFIGLDTLIVVACLTLSLRLLCYPLLFSRFSAPVHYILVLETVHAVTYAAGWSACAVNASKISPPRLEATSQAIFQSLWGGVGAGTGAIVGGIVYHHHGPDAVFYYASAAVGGGGAICAFILFFSHINARIQQQQQGLS